MHYSGRSAGGSATASDVSDLDHFVGMRAAGCGDVDDVTCNLAHERARDRRRDADTTGFDVGLVLADDLIADRLAVVLIFEIDRRAEGHLSTGRHGRIRRVDDFRGRELRLDFADAPLDEPLL